MHAHGAVLDLAAIAIVLPIDPSSMFAAFMRSRFVDQTDRLIVAVVAGDNLLAPVAQLFFIPLDHFQKAL